MKIYPELKKHVIRKVGRGRKNAHAYSTPQFCSQLDKRHTTLLMDCSTRRPSSQRPRDQASCTRSTCEDSRQDYAYDLILQVLLPDFAMILKYWAAMIFVLSSGDRLDSTYHLDPAHLSSSTSEPHQLIEAAGNISKKPDS